MSSPKAQATILSYRLELARQKLFMALRDLGLYLQGKAEVVRRREDLPPAEFAARLVLRDAGDVARLMGEVEALQAADALLRPKREGVAALIPEGGS